jgi:CRP-like cAMP-binding protein
MQMSTVLGRWYKDGQIVCRQGEPGDCMYVIQQGEIELMRRDGSKEFCLAVLKEGDFWGEAALLERDHLRTATARAIGDTSILSVEKRMFLTRIQEDPSFVLKVMRKMSRRIHELEIALVRSADSPAMPAVPVQLTAGAPGEKNG